MKNITAEYFMYNPRTVWNMNDLRHEEKKNIYISYTS